MNELEKFCSPGTICSTRQVEVNENVTLQVTTFIPANPTHNPEIVFVPGWKNALIEMSRDFTIHYVEACEKKSANVKGKVRYEVENFARDIAAVIDAFGLKDREYILGGSSLGATAIVDSYRFLSNRPFCLMLIGVNAVFYMPKFGMCIVRIFPPCLYLVFKPILKWYLRIFRLDIKNDYAQYEKYCRNIESANPWRLKKSALAFIHYSIWNHLSDIDIPTLLFGASKDELHNRENILRIHNLLPGSIYVDLETNSNTHSELMVIEMRKFLTNIAPI
ncbi:MAG: hypothetical protein COT43_03805 [Candidatus Marinimicrobia bacterium CG08_land_8_20_14_0_20_45_22]|nr:MAG: hypothetical protein COT43_03805 [Candidatus Marinimicrobia bacterium CG08_land_8_20_14_0_20_45_22]